MDQEIIVNYACGWCGNPTDKDGNLLNEQDFLNWKPENLEAVHGECCLDKETEKMLITRDMAIDAGDLSLEGQIY
jgi:hypothetical protein